MTSTFALEIEVACLEKINWSWLHAGMPPVWDLAVRNPGPDFTAGLSLQLQIPDFLDTGPVPLPSLAAGATHRVETANLPWVTRDLDRAMRLTAPRATHLRIEVGGHTTLVPLTLLPPHEWHPGVGWNKGFILTARVELRKASAHLPPGGAVTTKPDPRTWGHGWPMQAATAALILPTSPTVARVKRHALCLLDAIVGRRQVPLEQWIVGDRLQQLQVVQAVFAALLDLYPRAVHDIEQFSPEQATQRIRFPDEAVLEGTDRQGATCVDYALLLCAALEACGMPPLFVMIGSKAGLCHAMAGCWLSIPYGEGTLLTDADAVRQYVKDGDLLIVDVTEFSRGQSFHAACELGAERLAPPYHFCYALDVHKARVDEGIKPLPWRPAAAEFTPRPPRLTHMLPPAAHFQPRPELDALAGFWGQPGGGVLAAVGIGGAGKTALAERFLCELPGSSLVSGAVRKRTELAPPDGLFVWSFYESADSAAFVRELFDYACEGPPPADLLTTGLSRVQEALTRPRGRRTLLVLDGLEKVQKEQNVLGEFTEDAAPLRRLLRWAAASPGGVWVLATSRFPLTDLAPYRERGGYRLLDLIELERSAAHELLRVHGVKGDAEELDALLEEFGRHPLTLAHLARLLAEYFQGDPKKASELPPLQEAGGPSELEVQARRLARVLAGVESVLSDEERALLKAISVFRAPVDQETLAATWRHVEGSAPLSGLRLQQSLSRLTDLRFLQVHPGDRSRRYAAHPLLNQYFYRAMQEDARLAHDGARDFLQRELEEQQYRVQVRGAVRVRGVSPSRRPGDPLPTDRVVLDLLEELIYHTLKAGRPEEAYRLYRDNLGGYRHLGGALCDHARGERIVALFLPPAPTAPRSGWAPWLDGLRADHLLFLQALARE